MTEREIVRRLHDGAWTCVHRGAHLIGPAPPSWLHRAHGAVMAAGLGAALSHPAGGAHLGFDTSRRR